jgi:hypothetical protein
MAEILHYPDTSPERIDITATRGDSIEVTIDDVRDVSDPADPLPYPIEDASLSFRVQIRRRDGTVVLDSEDGAEAIAITAHEGTDLADDPSYLLIQVPYEAADESLAVGIYRWDLERTDSGETPPIRTTWYRGDLIIQDDATRP